MPQQPSDWQTVTPEPDDWQTVAAPSPASKPALTSPVESSWYDDVASYIPQPVKSAWNTIWNPLSDLPSRAASAISEPLMSYGESGSDWTRKPALYGGAFAQSVGDVVSGLTSPGNLALTVATGGAGLARGAALPRVAQAMTGASRVAGGATAAHGATLAADPNADWMQRGMGALEMVGGGLVSRAPKPRVVKGAGALEDLPVRQPAASINPAEVTPESMPVRPPEVANVKPNLRANLDGTFTDTSNAQIFDKAGNPVKPFDPSSLQGLEPAVKPEIQFINPKTGKIVPASQARPGDIPITSSPARRSISNSEMGRPIEETTARPTPEIEQPVPPGGNEFQPDIPIVNEPVLGGTSIRPQGTTGEIRGSTLTPEMATANEAPRFIETPPISSSSTGYDYRTSVEGLPKDQARFNKFMAAAVDFPEEVFTELATLAKRYRALGGRGKEAAKIGNEMIIIKDFMEGTGKFSKITPESLSAKPPSVATSLAQRLRRAVDDAGKPNAAAPEDISQIIDEAIETLNKLPEGPTKQGIIRQTLNANKALLTAWDLSAPGRQGKAFMLNKAWWTSLDDMVKAWGSKEAAHNINQSILDHPSGYFKKSVSETGKAGKSFADEIGLDLAAHEEMFTGVIERMGAKIPLVQRSSRAHTAFLNKLRSDQFVSMMEASKEVGLNPETDMRLGKAYAKFINDATGRGSLNIGKWKLERNVSTLNDVFFAPKNMSGQIRTWNAVLNPYKYWQADKTLRWQALRSLFAVAGMGLGVGEVARIAGAKVSNDPTSADFRKIKIGDTRIDPFGGYQQFPVAAMKLLIGQSTSTISGKTTDLTAGKFGQQTRVSVAERFFINRLSPAGSFIYAWMSNREFDGKPFEVKRALYERTFPIAAKDIWDMAQEDPALAAMLGPTTLMGLTGTQTYTGR